MKKILLSLLLIITTIYGNTNLFPVKEGGYKIPDYYEGYDISNMEIYTIGGYIGTYKAEIDDLGDNFYAAYLNTDIHAKVIRFELRNDTLVVTNAQYREGEYCRHCKDYNSMPIARSESDNGYGIAIENVEVGGQELLPTPPTKPEWLYRKDSRSPEEIFNAGFTALGTDTNLFRHIAGFNSMGRGTRPNELTAFISTTSDRQYAVDFQSHRDVTQWVYQFTPPPHTYDALYSLETEATNLEDDNLRRQYLNLANTHLQRSQQQWISYRHIPREYIQSAHRVIYNRETGEATITETVNNRHFNPFLANGASTEAFPMGLLPGELTFGQETVAGAVRNFFLAFSCLGIQSSNNRNSTTTCIAPDEQTIKISGNPNSIYYDIDSPIGNLVTSSGNDDNWVDFDGDGRFDYCAHYYGTESREQGLQCNLQQDNGHSFKNIKLTKNINNFGKSGSRWWVDADGDGKTDYCRIVDYYTKVRCSYSNGEGFDEEVTTEYFDVGYEGYRWWTDVNGDNKQDFCRLTYDYGEYRIRCRLSLGRKFTRGDLAFRDAPPISADYGIRSSIQWVDINNDGAADYCRSIGSYGWSLRCNLSKPFVAEDRNPGAFNYIYQIDALRYTSSYVQPRHSGFQWADVDGNGLMDYCTSQADHKLMCTLLKYKDDKGNLVYDKPKNWLNIPKMNYDNFQLIDINSDGKWDICKHDTVNFSCALSDGKKFTDFVKYDSTAPIGSGGFYGKYKFIGKSPVNNLTQFCRATTQGQAVCIDIFSSKDKK